MARLSASASCLVVIDLQTRLMPSIHEGDKLLSRISRMIEAARQLSIPICATEQTPGRLEGEPGNGLEGGLEGGLGPTVAEIGLTPDIPVFTKTRFDASDALSNRFPKDHTFLLSGCEAHVCVLQTALGLSKAGHSVAVMEDLIGSRTAQNKAAALRRLQYHAIEIVTTEMVLFEWLESSDHSSFRNILKLIK